MQYGLEFCGDSVRTGHNFESWDEHIEIYNVEMKVDRMPIYRHCKVYRKQKVWYTMYVRWAEEAKLIKYAETINPQLLGTLLEDYWITVW